MATKKAGKPAKGKAKAKMVTDPKTGKKVKRSYGQAGKAKDGKARVKPGTKKGDAYCAAPLVLRSAKTRRVLMT